MKICFHGAARTVTGSKHRLVTSAGTQVLLDCGMFQGLGTETDTLNTDLGFDAASIHFVILSHAHIDHTGLLPKLVKEGFSGPIYCTEATRELTEILLYDSAEIQSAGNNECPVLYTVSDVEATMQLMHVIEINQTFSPAHDVRVVCTNAGHLPGSVVIHLTITEEGNETTVMYSGDIGKYRSTLLEAPAICPQADYIILESTYGNTHHDIHFSVVESLAKWINHTCIEKKGKLVIPAFSVGRTQELLYALNQLELEKRLPDLPYFVDSPLGHKATEVIKKHTPYFNARMQKVLEIDDDPFLFKGLKYVDSAEDSMKLVNYQEPCVIISASGTADAGRVRHHLNSCLENADNTILLAGFCTQSSTGGKLLQGKKKLEMFGKNLSVASCISKLDGMSAHADHDDLCRFLSCQDKDLVKGIFLVHGEYLVQQEFAEKLSRKGYRNIMMPGLHHESCMEVLTSGSQAETWVA